MDPIPEPPDDATGRALVDRARAGDRSAGGELYRRYHDELLFAIRARLGTRLRAVLQSEDVLQSVALEVFRDLDRFEHRGPGSFSAWLRRIVVTKVADLADRFSAEKRDTDRLRGESALVELAEPAPGYPEGPARYDDPRFEALERALSSLPDEMRSVIVLRRIEGLSSREAAERMGKTDDAVRQLHTRALARLALQMGHGRRQT